MRLEADFGDSTISGTVSVGNIPLWGQTLPLNTSQGPINLWQWAGIDSFEFHDIPINADGSFTTGHRGISATAEMSRRTINVYGPRNGATSVISPPIERREAETVRKKTIREASAARDEAVLSDGEDFIRIYSSAVH